MTNVTSYPQKRGLLQKILSRPDLEVTTHFVGWIIERTRELKPLFYNSQSAGTDPGTDPDSCVCGFYFLSTFRSVEAASAVVIIVFVVAETIF
jgi:hypothetical protein